MLTRIFFSLSIHVMANARACVRVFQGQLLNVWQDLSQSELSLNQQLAEFYDTLLSTWHSQLQWSSQVPDPNLHTHTHTHTEQLQVHTPSHHYCTDTHTHNYINTHYHTRTPTNNYTLTHTIAHPHSYTHTLSTHTQRDTQTGPVSVTHHHTHTPVVTAGCTASLPRCLGTRTRW